MTPIALLRLCQLISPALPVGAYAYSQGLEYAVGAGWVHDEASTLQWIAGLSRHGLGTLDLPLLRRLHAAWRGPDRALVAHWNEQLLAARETAELRLQERELGRALARVLVQLELQEAAAWQDSGLAYAALFALAAARWSLSERETLSAYLWSWSENQVLAAVRLVPLGQSAGVRLLHQLLGSMPAIVARARSVEDEQLGTGAFSQGLASSLHETQYTRLFRS